MSPERWEQISDVLNDALEVPIAQRDAYLDGVCARDTELRREVESLIEAHEEASSRVPWPFGGARVPKIEQLADHELGPTAPSHRAVPERVGPYRIEQRLGEGGMGTVYRAVRADREFEQRVAVKILRADLLDGEWVQRFRAERQILARLEHANVARLIDGGTTENGRPYLVMEYIEGQPLDRYCDRQDISLERRLELFRKICAAVHVAHQNLIVHRDLKPANILVGEDGEPKLLDFGIAKLLQPRESVHTLVATLPGMGPMTLSHASPEQIRGQTITTASDVYSLGVVLYELLAGRLPYPAADGYDLQQMATEICELESPPPSSVTTYASRWQRRLTGDLDMICLKALRKEAEHRYASAEQLANDLRRYQRRLPVIAQGDAWRYRSAKFLRRHRLAVAAAALITTLTAGFIITLLVQRQQIQQKQRSSQEVARLMIDLFDNADPDRALGERLTARELLDRGARSMQGRLDDEPEVRATLLETLGQVYRKLGLLAEAEPLLEEALELRRDTRGPRDPVTAETLRQLGDRDFSAGHYARAEQRFREALVSLGARPGAPLALTLGGIARTLRAQGDLDAASDHFDRALEAGRASLDDEDPVIARILQGRAGLEQEQGDLQAAQESLERALAIYRQAHGERHPEVAGTMQSIAMVLADRQLFTESDALFGDVLALQRQFYDGPHPALATTLDSLASSLFARGRFKDAEPLALEALEIRRQIYGDDHSRVARSINLLGLIRASEGQGDEAERLFRQAIDVWQRLRGTDHPEIIGVLANLGELLVQRGQLDAGAEHLEEALRISRAVYGEDHVQPAILSTTLGKARDLQGDLAGAEALYRQALPVLESSLGPRHARVATLRQNLGVVLRSADRLPEAEAEILKALAIYRETYDADHYFVAITLKNLATVLRDQGRFEEAETAVREALEIYAKVYPDDHSRVVVARDVLASILARQRR